MENHDLESRRLEGRAELRLLEVGGVRVRTRTLTCGVDPGFDVATLERCVACVPATLEDCLSGIDEAASGDRSSPPEERELRARVLVQLQCLRPASAAASASAELAAACSSRTASRICEADDGSGFTEEVRPYCRRRIFLCRRSSHGHRSCGIHLRHMADDGSRLEVRCPRTCCCSSFT